jgi:hypothetical protein
MDLYLKWFQMILVSLFATVAGMIFIFSPAATETTMFWLGAVGLILFTAVLIAHQTRRLHVPQERDSAAANDSPNAIITVPEQIGFVARTDENAKVVVRRQTGLSELQPIKLDDIQKQLQSLLHDVHQQRELIQRSPRRQ